MASSSGPFPARDDVAVAELDVAPCAGPREVHADRRCAVRQFDVGTHGRDLRGEVVVREVEATVTDEHHVAAGMASVRGDHAVDVAAGRHHDVGRDHVCGAVPQIRSEHGGDRPDLTVELVTVAVVAGVAEPARLAVQRKDLVAPRLVPPRACSSSSRSGWGAARSWTSEKSSATWYSSHTSSSNAFVGSVSGS